MITYKYYESIDKLEPIKEIEVNDIEMQMPEDWIEVGDNCIPYYPILIRGDKTIYYIIEEDLRKIIDN